jgi:prepilin-type N-terminal cleavage/methylation domain-containing protein
MTPQAEVRNNARPARPRHDGDAGARKRVALRLLSVANMREQRGFTLIEVLVVIVLVGVLSGLAISQYASFRARGFDAKVAAVVRGVATGEEAYYADNRTYAADVDALNSMVVGDVAITIAAGNSGDLTRSFRVVGTHPGAARTFTWVSDPAPGEPNLMVD